MHTDTSIDQEIRRKLGPSERLLWCGRPLQGLVLRAAGVFLIPFGIAWCGFAILWETVVIAGGAPLLFALWGIPFVLFALYLMVGRFWLDARQRAVTAYAVTSERVLVISGLRSRRVQSLSISSLPDISLNERAGGGGVIAFGPGLFGHNWRGGAGWADRAPYLAPSFRLPDGAREVYEVIRRGPAGGPAHQVQVTARRQPLVALALAPPGRPSPGRLILLPPIVCREIAHH